MNNPKKPTQMFTHLANPTTPLFAARGYCVEFLESTSDQSQLIHLIYELVSFHARNERERGLIFSPLSCLARCSQYITEQSNLMQYIHGVVSWKEKVSLLVFTLSAKTPTKTNASSSLTELGSGLVYVRGYTTFRQRESAGEAADASANDCDAQLAL